MNTRQKIIVTLIGIATILILFLVYTKLFTKATSTTLSASTYWRIPDTLDYNTTHSLPAIQAFQDLGLKPSNSYNQAQFIMFQTLNMIDRIMPKVKFPKHTKWVFGLCGSDLLASKSLFALTMSTSSASYLLPPTWITEGGVDQERFKHEFQEGELYILKRNVQRQEGFLITRDKDILFGAFNKYQTPSLNNWVVCQKLLQDPLVILGADNVRRKINLRVYLLVVVDESSNATMYMYNDGFIYYTADAWKANTTDQGPNITTGYIDRQVYIDNPLTTQDLFKHLGTNQLHESILKALGKVAKIYNPIFEKSNKNMPGTKFLIYGCDIAAAADLSVTIMEVNKGPDLGYKDDRDRELKLGMVREACEIVGILNNQNNTENKFIRI